MANKVIHTLEKNTVDPMYKLLQTIRCSAGDKPGLTKRYNCQINNGKVMMRLTVNDSEETV